VDRLQILGGAIIRTTTITTIANRTPPRPGITASDPAGYYPYVGQCNTGWQQFQVVDARSRPLSRKAVHSAPRGFGAEAAGGRLTWRCPGRRSGVKRSEGDRSAADRLRRARLGFLAFRRSRQPQPFAEVLALRAVHQVVTHRFGAEFGDGKIGGETLGDGTDFGCFREQPGKTQGARQDEL